jgi:hypothetical protein
VTGANRFNGFKGFKGFKRFGRFKRVRAGSAFAGFRAHVQTVPAVRRSEADTRLEVHRRTS